MRPAADAATPYDWNLIRVFLAALDTGSLLGAARRLHSSQPTVGRQIAALEAQLKLVLFERTGRGLAPTEDALRLAERARAMEDAALDLARGALERRDELAGSVRISASQPVACFLLPPLVTELQARLPAVQIDIVASNTVSNLLRREADIAVRMMRPEQGSLVARKLADLGVGLYATHEYLERHGTPTRLSELDQHRLVGEDQSDVILRGFQRFDVPLRRENFSLRSDDIIVQWRAVSAGAGIGVVVDYMARRDPALVRVLPQVPVPSLPMWLVVHREIHANRTIRAVYDHLAEALPTAL